jgi:hypothetical protein
MNLTANFRTNDFTIPSDFKRLFDFKHAFETTSGQKGTPSVKNRGKTSAGVARPVAQRSVARRTRWLA